MGSAVPENLVAHVGQHLGEIWSATFPGVERHNLYSVGLRNLSASVTEGRPARKRIGQDEDEPAAGEVGGCWRLEYVTEEYDTCDDIFKPPLRMNTQ